MTSLERLFGEQSRVHELEPIGVIDIGSNSVRLVVYEGAVRAPTPIFNEKVLCGLGRSIATTGKLGEESRRAGARSAAPLPRHLAHPQASRTCARIATAAVREADDGADFIARAEKACGARIEVLSGEKEAELAAYGILMGFVEADGIAGDLGGGSLELIDIATDRLSEAATLPLGGLRLIERPATRSRRRSRSSTRRCAQVPGSADGRGRPFFAVGGTWRALAKLHMEQTNYPLRVMHGYTIPTREAIDFCELVRKTKKLSASPASRSWRRPRREVLPYGALVLERLLQGA